VIHNHDLHGEDAVLTLTSLTKSFAGMRALVDVDLDVRAGEVHALVGQNGSGKSTLIKVLAGYHGADEGATAVFDGDPIDLSAVAATRHSGLRFVHQDLGLILQLSAMDNMALRGGFARGLGRRIDWKGQEKITRQLLARFDADLDIRAPLAEATPIQRTIVAITLALAGWTGGRGLLVLDEPTAVLPHTEVNRLLEIVREVRASGTSVLYVSHRLDEVFEIADRVTVLRDGRQIATRAAADLDSQSLAELMVGSDVDAHYRASYPADRDQRVAFRARDLQGRYLQGTSFEVHVGEVLGLAGLPGSGVEEIPLVVAGVHGGTVTGQVQFPLLGGGWVDASAPSRPTTPIVPADRSGQGVIAQMSVRENLSLSVLGRLRSRARLNAKQEDGLVARWFSNVNIKASSPDASIMSLSGGNQQKVVLARCMAVEPQVLVLAEPTAGVDIGTRQSIYELVAERAREGLAVVVTSTDAADLIALCHRVLVVNKGVVVSELVGRQVTEHELLWRMEEVAVA
jgi:ABC-type sugar transport system ATPase subunit